MELNLCWKQSFSKCANHFFLFLLDSLTSLCWNTLAASVPTQGMERIESLDPKAFSAYLQETRNTICGRHPIAVLLNVSWSHDNHLIFLYCHVTCRLCRNSSPATVSWTASWSLSITPSPTSARVNLTAQSATPLPPSSSPRPISHSHTRGFPFHWPNSIISYETKHTWANYCISFPLPTSAPLCIRSMFMLIFANQLLLRRNYSQCMPNTRMLAAFWLLTSLFSWFLHHIKIHLSIL